MRVAIHQPNLFPWIGYFLKIHLADVFIFHDNVSVNKRSYTHRCRIGTQKNSRNKDQFVSFRISEESKISDISYLQSQEDFTSLKVKLKNVYGHAPHFNELSDFINKHSTLFLSNQTLSKFNSQIIMTIAKELGLKTTFVFSSKLASTKKKDDHNLALVQWQNGTKYLSGLGAKEYQNECVFSEAGITLEYLHSLDYLQEFASKVPFDPSLSILDAVGILGWEKVKECITEFEIARFLKEV